MIAAAALSATAAGIALSHRRWAAAADPTEGAVLGLPDGHTVAIPTSDGAELVATVAGPADGRTFILVHGWTHDRRIWAAVARRLVAHGHRVVAYDQRGHGESTVGSDGLTMDVLAADMDEVLTATDASNAVLVGHSMGGMAAQAFALNHPESVRKRVAAIAMVSTACDGMARVNRSMGPFVDRAIADRALAFKVLAPVLVRRSLGRTPHIGHLRAIRDLFVATPPDVRRQLRSAINGMDFSARLADIEVPVLVLSGRRDGIVPHARSTRIAELLESAELHVFDDAGHMLPWEAPDELVEILTAVPAGR